MTQEIESVRHFLYRFAELAASLSNGKQYGIHISILKPAPDILALARAEGRPVMNDAGSLLAYHLDLLDGSVIVAVHNNNV